MKISAGTLGNINWKDGGWLILDLGFSNQTESCAILQQDGIEDCFTYGKAVEKIIEIAEKNRTTNLVIEAPLSVSFDRHDNPKGRQGERLDNGQHRYWYVGLGCSVLVASSYLIKKLADHPSTAEIRLFEGFVSFKERGKKSDHLADVNSLRKAIEGYYGGCDHVIRPDDVTLDDGDRVTSAFDILGLNIGIPPIICGKI